MEVNIRAVLAMVLNALDRDAAEGKSARGEMAKELRAALEAPVPPAGDVEVVGYAGRNALKGFMNNGTEVTVMLKKQHFYDIALTPLENATRLTAELDGLLGEVERLNDLLAKEGRHFDAVWQKGLDLQSELTKARELLLVLREQGLTPVTAAAIRIFLAHQSAPAVKLDPAVDCGDCPLITDGCRGTCMKAPAAKGEGDE